MGEMMANISHQWKQPLNTISLSIVNLKLGKRSLEESSIYYNIMEENINYLVNTVDDFMSFFDKKTHAECRSIELIIQEVKSIVEAQLSNKNINLEFKIDMENVSVKVASSISQIWQTTTRSVLSTSLSMVFVTVARNNNELIY